jgi:hypothetical protein
MTSMLLIASIAVAWASNPTSTTWSDRFEDIDVDSIIISIPRTAALKSKSLNHDWGKF